jgi:hypothetical protein
MANRICRHSPGYNSTVSSNPTPCHYLVPSRRGQCKISSSVVLSPSFYAHKSNQKRPGLSFDPLHPVPHMLQLRRAKATSSALHEVHKYSPTHCGPWREPFCPTLRSSEGSGRSGRDTARRPTDRRTLERGTFGKP